MLFVAHGQGNRTSGYYGTCCNKSDITRVGGPSEGCTGRVHDNAEFVFRNADSAAQTTLGGVNTLGFTLNGKHSVLTPVGLKYAALDGKVRLTAGCEASFYNVGSIVDDFLNLQRILKAYALQNRLLSEHVRSILMYAGCIRHNGLKIGQGCRQLFDIYGNLGCCSTGVAGVVRKNQSYNIAPAMNLLVLKNLTGRLHNGTSLMELTLSHDVGTAGFDDILGKDDLVNAGHLLSFLGVDSQNLCMVGDLRLYDGGIQSAFRHLHSLIIAVVSETADLCKTIRSGERLAQEFAFLRGTGHHIFHSPRTTFAAAMTASTICL